MMIEYYLASMLASQIVSGHISRESQDWIFRPSKNYILHSPRTTNIQSKRLNKDLFNWKYLVFVEHAPLWEMFENSHSLHSVTAQIKSYNW